MTKVTSYFTSTGMSWLCISFTTERLTWQTRARWRHLRQRRLDAEEAADEKSRRFEEQEAENLRRESEDFLARQMDEMQALAEEQRKAGLLLDDGAPVRLNVSITQTAGKEKEPSHKEKTVVFAQDDEEDDALKKRRAPLVKLDFSAAESGEKTRERLQTIRESVPHDKETLFKSKVRWDGLNDVRCSYQTSLFLDLMHSFSFSLWLIESWNLWSGS